MAGIKTFLTSYSTPTNQSTIFQGDFEPITKMNFRDFKRQVKENLKERNINKTNSS